MILITLTVLISLAVLLHEVIDFVKEFLCVSNKIKVEKNDREKNGEKSIEKKDKKASGN